MANILLSLKTELEELKAKREQQNVLINEEDIKILELSAKDFRKKIKALDLKLLEIKDPEELIKTSNLVQALKDLLKTTEDELSQKRELIKDRVSSIEIAKLEARIEIRQDKKTALIKMAIAWLFLEAGLISLALIFSQVGEYALLHLMEIKNPSTYSFLLFFVLLLVVNAGILMTGYKEVPHNHVIIMEFMGEYLMTWEAGPHIRFPIFMKEKQDIINRKRGGRVFLGVITETLRLSAETTDGKMSAKMDFTDASAEVAVTLFFRVINPKLAIYAIENVVEAIKEKMESGIRAYFGNLGTDEAIRTRAEIEVREIIVQHATEARVFKDWGIEIVGLAITDIKLPKEVEEQRIRKLTAEKEKEVALVQKDTAAINAETAKSKGKEKANEIKEMVKTLSGDGGEKVSSEKAMNFILQLKKFEVYGKAKSLVITDSKAGTMGATMGAADENT